MKPSMTLACLVLGVAALGGCGGPVNCAGGVYRNGCAPGDISAAPPTPAPAAAVPAAASPAPVSPAPVSPTPVSRPVVPYGDPASFADIDDKQCRSYGLTFGSRDYADCRIRLSAQHRGLDPSIGTTPAR
jgi:hypothetical protein